MVSLDKGDYVITGELMGTRVPEIFVAGDAATAVAMLVERLLSSCWWLAKGVWII